jgi:hypothetical protein
MAKPAQTGPICRKLTRTACFVYRKRASVQIEKADRGVLIHCPSISARRHARHPTERVREMLLVRKPALPRDFRKANVWIRQE